MKSMGEKIREYRRSKGMSQKDLADCLDITSQAVSKWESGASLPDLMMLPEIAALFGIQIDDLFEYAKEQRYESIEKKIEYGRLFSNVEFAREEGFLLQEVEKDPDCYRALSLLGDLYHYHATCMNRKSVHFAKMALRLKPNAKCDINNINNASGGSIFDYDVGNHAELIAYWQALLREAPENKRVYFYLLDDLIDACRYDEARVTLLESRRNNPDSLNDYYELFIVEKESGFVKVEDAYRDLVEKYRMDWRVLFQVANSYSYHGRFGQAIEVWQMAYDCMDHPRFVDPLEAMAQCSIHLHRNEDAIGYYQEELTLLKKEWNMTYGLQVDEIVEKINHLKK